MAHLVSMFWISFSAEPPSDALSALRLVKFSGWQRLHTEYAKQFGIETPNRPSQATQQS